MADENNQEIEVKGDNLTKYWQWNAELNEYPIFVQTSSDEFWPGLEEILAKAQFSIVSEAAWEKAQKKENARLLKIASPTARVSKQIGKHYEHDKYGDEKVTVESGHRIYRYKGVCLMIFSFLAKEWEMALMHNLNQTSTNLEIALCRFLSLSLSPFGIVSFWGKTEVEKGQCSLLLSRVTDVTSSAIYVDIRKKLILSEDGANIFSAGLEIFRLSTSVTKTEKLLRPEEYVSFLTSHCAYFDFSGLSPYIRQAIHTLAKNSIGKEISQASFQELQNLSI